MNTRQVIIRRFAIGPLAQWGLVAGVLIACLPAFVCSAILFSLIGSLHGMLASWRDVGLTILGQRISFNLLDVLNLNGFMQSLNGIASFGFFGVVLLALGVAALLGVFGAIVMVLLGLFYNATGRLRLELEEVETDDQKGQ